MRRAAKKDANHTQIAQALEAAGVSVLDLSQLGGGVPDLLACRGPRCWLFEVKDGTKPPSARRLTDDQIKFKARWLGQWAVVESAEQAVAIVGAK